MIAADANTADRVADIEAALDQLLRTAIADDAAYSAARPAVFEVLSLRDILKSAEMTRAEADAAAIIKRPVGRACRMAIRCLGKELFRRVRTVDAMGDVVERVCNMDPAQWRAIGPRSSTMPGMGSAKATAGGGHDGLHHSARPGARRQLSKL